MEIIIPEIEQKYITLFETQQGYDDAEPGFIEVNWSAVKDEEHPEEIETEYYPSRRQTHGHDIVDNIHIFPDASHKALSYTYDHILKTFFLEILWGYYGWEWADYEYTDPDTSETVILKGGNLYKVKEITEVPSIPDGYRLEHINNFINSQNKVSVVNFFDTSNIVTMRNAFAGGSNDITININTFPKVTDAYRAFYYKSVNLKIKDDILHFPVLENFTNMFELTKYSGGFDKLIIDAPYVTDVTSMFTYASLGCSSLDINDLFNGHIERIKILDNMFANAAPERIITGTPPVEITIDLTDSEYSSGTVISMDNFASGASNMHWPFELNIKTNHSITLNNAFAQRDNPVINLNGGNAYISEIESAFSYCTINNAMPTSAPYNNTVKDSYLYKNAKIYVPVVYDFSPNNQFITTKGHFANVTFYNYAPVFSNVDRLINVDFSGVIANNVSIPINFQIYNSNYIYPQGDGNIKHINDVNNDYKYRKIVFGEGFTSIVDQEFYVSNLNENVFGANMLITEGSNVKVHFYNSINFYNVVSTITPYLYLDTVLYTARTLSIRGLNIKDIYIISSLSSQTYSDPPTRYVPSGLQLNWNIQNLPALINIYVTGRLNPSKLDLTGQYNINATNLESFVDQQDVIDILQIQQAYYNTLSSTLQNKLLAVCNTINLIQEST